MSYLSVLVGGAGRRQVSLPSLCAIFAFVLSLLSASGVARAANYDGFDPNVNGNVFANVVQPDGKVLIGGTFTTLQPNGRGSPVIQSYLARMNADGTLDTSFSPVIGSNAASGAGPDAEIDAIALQPDGRIIVGGRFDYVQGASGTKYTRSGLARLNSDGSIDAGFDPRPISPMASQAPVYAIAVQKDGKILIGGGFTSLQPNGGSSVGRSRLARLNSDGSLDSGFDPSPNGIVYCIAVQRNGQVLFGGGFTQYNPRGGAVVNQVHFGRVNADGSADTSFTINVDNIVRAIIVHPDDHIMIGGDFLNITGSLDQTPWAKAYLAKIRPDGSIDSDFYASTNGKVNAFAFQSDGQLVLGGEFNIVYSVSGATTGGRGVARMTWVGNVDTSFAPSANSTVKAVAVGPDDRIVIGGYFSRVTAGGSGFAAVRYHIARLQSDGSLDAPFTPDASGNVATMVRLSDGSIIVGGSFGTMGGLTRWSLAKIAANGTVDNTFVVNVQGTVSALALQSDGKLLVAGNFGLIGPPGNGILKHYLARLNTTDGTVDTSFDPNPNGAVNAVTVQSDGKILVGGNFSSFQPNGTLNTGVTLTTTARTYMARLNSDGTVDTGFDAAPNGAVGAIKVQTDGNILLSGVFTTVTGTTSSVASPVSYMARVNAGGNVDTTFRPFPDGPVYDFITQADGKIVLVGNFNSLLPNSDTTATTRNHVARVGADGNVDKTFDPNTDLMAATVRQLADGSLVIGGSFGSLQPNETGPEIPRTGIAVLNIDGTPKSGFNLSTNNSVSSALVQPDGTILLSGNFNALIDDNGVTYPATNHIARLTSSLTFDPTFVVIGVKDSVTAVNALATQKDGRMLIGGNFGGFGGGRTTNLARLLVGGVVDTSFTSNANGAVNAIMVPAAAQATSVTGNLFAWLNNDGTFRPSFSLSNFSSITGNVAAVLVQPDGKIILAGDLTNTTGVGGGTIIRFNPDGSIDGSFVPNPGNTVRTMALQSDGKILVGGDFTTMYPQGASTVTTRNRIARLNADGSLDTGFDPNVDAPVRTIVVQPDGKILVGGEFIVAQPNGATTATTRSHMMRLNSDGTLDTSFDPYPDGSVDTIVLDGTNIVIGGAFSNLRPNGATANTGRRFMARIASTGLLDTGFNPTANGEVYKIKLQADGHYLVGGNFTAFYPNPTSTTTGGSTAAVPADYIARINSDGTVDKGFTTVTDSPVYDIEVGTDGKIYIGGSFTSVFPSVGADGVTRNHVARLNADGSLDPNFNPNANGLVFNVVPRDDGSVLVGGNFTEINPRGTNYIGGAFTTLGGTDVPYLARMNIDGNADPSFRPVPNGTVNALAQYLDGRFIVAGDFTQIGGASHGRVARFNLDSSVDASFNATVDGSVQSVALQQDGRVLIGGSFANVSGIPRPSLARLNSDGSLDAGFSPGADGTVTSLFVQADGKIIASGAFTHIAGSSRAYLARLNSDGSIDGSFTPSVDGPVYTVALQADGSVFIGGDFNTVDGVAHSKLARVTATGALDTGIAVQVDGPVNTIALQSDGRPLFGGAFSKVDNVVRFLVGRVPSVALATQTFAVSADRSVLTWSRAGSAPSLQAVTFSYTTDLTNYYTLGNATLTSSGAWQLTGVSALPANTSYYIRALAIESTTRNGSSGLLQSDWHFYNNVPTGPNAFDYGLGSAPSSNSSGSSTTNSGTTTGSTSTASLTPSSFTPGGTRLVNLSSRVQLGATETFTDGFVIEGSGAKQVLVRAIGPGLQSFGVSGYVGAPRLRVYDNNHQLLAENSGWSTNTALSAVFSAAGAFPLASGSTDAAVSLSLSPGAYTVEVSDVQQKGGVLLTEIYEVGHDAGDAKLVNLSARGSSAGGNGVLIGGFVVWGDTPKRVLVRAIGPSLANYGVTGLLADPKLLIYDQNNNLIAQNDNWSATEISDAATRAGAWPLNANSTDAAVAITLPPGAYTAQISGPSGETGVVMIEVYDVP